MSPLAAREKHRLYDAIGQRFESKAADGFNHPLPARMATFASAAYHTLRKPMNVNWAGFYEVERAKSGKVRHLSLSPQGNDDDIYGCLRLEAESGICSAVAERGQTIVVPDVTDREWLQRHGLKHHPCEDNPNAAHGSEIVVPVGEHFIYDMDSTVIKTFSIVDRSRLEEFMRRYILTRGAIRRIFPTARVESCPSRSCSAFI